MQVRHQWIQTRIWPERPAASTPPQFYMEGVWRNPYFWPKCGLFFLHTNPDAASLNLNRAESGVLRRRSSAAAADGIRSQQGQRGKPKSCVCVSPWASAALSNSPGPAAPSVLQTHAASSTEHALTPNTSTQTQSLQRTRSPALQLLPLAAARPQSSSKVKICYIMQPSIGFPGLGQRQLPAPQSKLEHFVPCADRFSST